MSPETTDSAFETDEQDQSEIFDEDAGGLDGDGRVRQERRTFEERPDVLDVTAAAGDEDDDAAMIGEDLDDEDIVALEADEDAEDLEDDDLAARMPEAVRLALEEAGGDPAFANRARRERDGPRDQVDLVFGGDLDGASQDDQADGAALEADLLADDDLEDLGYPNEDGASPSDGRPSKPDIFDIALAGRLWRLSRNGKPVRDYGHAERAVHEAVALAEELRHTGEPAVVYLHGGNGKVIEIVPGGFADVDSDDDGDDETKTTDRERSAIVPGRSPNG